MVKYSVHLKGLVLPVAGIVCLEFLWNILGSIINPMLLNIPLHLAKYGLYALAGYIASKFYNSETTESLIHGGIAGGLGAIIEGLLVSPLFYGWIFYMPGFPLFHALYQIISLSITGAFFGFIGSVLSGMAEFDFIEEYLKEIFDKLWNTPRPGDLGSDPGALHDPVDKTEEELEEPPFLDSDPSTQDDPVDKSPSEELDPSENKIKDKEKSVVPMNSYPYDYNLLPKQPDYENIDFAQRYDHYLKRLFTKIGVSYIGHSREVNRHDSDNELLSNLSTILQVYPKQPILEGVQIPENLREVFYLVLSREPNAQTFLQLWVENENEKIRGDARSYEWLRGSKPEKYPNKKQEK